MGRMASVSSFLLAAGLASFVAWDLPPLRINGSAVAASQQSDVERLQELRVLIEKEIGTPGANAPSQCKSIAFGSKACGGPERYLVYSTVKTNEARLKQLVNEFNQLAQKINEERKIRSDCMFVTEPMVEFVGGMCTIKGN